MKAQSSEMWSNISETGNFIWRHRSKVAIAAVLAIATAAYVHYSTSTAHAEMLQFHNGNDHDSTSEKERKRNHLQLSSTEKSKLLLRARRQYDAAIQYFLSTLKSKIVEVVDINSSVRQIKELRSSLASSTGSLNDTPSVLEAKLWDEIKIGSFCQLFVTSYMVSAVCVLLRVQMHILARSTSLFTSSSEELKDGEDSVSNSTFQSLVEGTYKHLFGSGLRNIASIIKQRISIELKDWTVDEKLNVEYAEFVQKIQQIRRSIENDVNNIVRLMIIRKSSEFEFHFKNNH